MDRSGSRRNSFQFSIDEYRSSHLWSHEREPYWWPGWNVKGLESDFLELQALCSQPEEEPLPPRLRQSHQIVLAALCEAQGINVASYHPVVVWLYFRTARRRIRVHPQEKYFSQQFQTREAAAEQPLSGG
jgi:hypothetical protein